MPRSHFISDFGTRYIALRPIYTMDRSFDVGDIVDLPVLQVRKYYALKWIGLEGDEWTKVQLDRIGYSKLEEVKESKMTSLSKDRKKPKKTRKEVD